MGAAASDACVEAYKTQIHVQLGTLSEPCGDCVDPYAECETDIQAALSALIQCLAVSPGAASLASVALLVFTYSVLKFMSPSLVGDGRANFPMIVSDFCPCEVCVDAYLFNLYNIKISPGPGGYACYGAKAGRQECQTAALLIDSLFQGCAAGPEILSSLTCSDSGAALAGTLASLVVLIGAFL